MKSSVLPRSLFQKNSFSNYIVGFVGGFILLQVVMILSTVRYDAQVIRSQTDQSAKGILSVYESNISNAMNRADADLRTIMNDSATINLLSNHSSLGRHHAMYNVQESLKSRLDSSSQSDAYVVANQDYDILLMARSSRVEYGLAGDIQEYVRGSFGNLEPGDSGWYVELVGGEPFLIHAYSYGQNLVCALIKISTLGSLYHSLFAEGSALVVTDLEGNLLLQQGSQPLEFPLDNGEGILRRRGYSVVTRELDRVGVRLSCVVATGDEAVVQAAPLFIVLIGMVALGFVAAFTIYSNREIITPMAQLMETTQIIEGGNLDYRPSLHCKNREFRALAVSFNSMLDMIIRLRIDSYERVIKQQDTELKYLNMQIRPHFFLNALSTVHSMTYKGDLVKIREFINTLSKNIRYMFKAGLHTVTVREEVEHIRNYLRCQEMLYPECVFSFIEVAPGAEEWQIPQMLLHTFVENVYKHALAVEDLTSLLIRVTLVEREGEQMACIVVEDNGAGFPPEVIAAVRGLDRGRDWSEGKTPDQSGSNLQGRGQEEDKDESRQIGLVNMAKTLRLMYGRESLLELSNKGSGGAAVKAYIPRENVLARGGAGNP